MQISKQKTVPLSPPTQKAARPRMWPAILVLYVLAAIIPECVATFNTTTLALVTNPLLIFFLTAFYGSANLLIRELMRRRPRSWGSILLLGIAFGCVNEGIIAGTWYSVVPKGYAMLGAINWGWAVSLTCFHTLFSVIIPICLTEVLFPNLANRPWLKRRGLIGFTILFVLTTLVGLLAPKYQLYRFLVLLAVIVITFIAVRLPRPAPRSEDMRIIPRLGRLRIAGFGGSFLFFCTIIVLPSILLQILTPALQGLAQVLDIMATLAVCTLFLIIVRRWSGRHAWGHAQTLALSTGALLPSILLALLLPQAWAGAQAIIVVPFLGFLIWLARRKQLQVSTTPVSWAETPFREY